MVLLVRSGSLLVQVSCMWLEGARNGGCDGYVVVMLGLCGGSMVLSGYS